MYGVSGEYLAAVRGAVRTERLTGRIALVDGSVIAFGPQDLMSGSVTIDNQCVTGEELQFGCVYLGQAAFQLKTDISRYKLYGGVVTLTYGIQLAGGGWYDLPLGVYTIGEAERTSVAVDIKAYDNILRLDKAFDTDRLSGTLYDMLHDVCTRCGLVLAQSREELAGYPNTDLTFDLLTTDGCETYRDCVGVLAQMAAAFAAVDRQGRLCLRRFGSEPAAVLGPSARSSATVADYECSYAALNVAGAESVYHCEREASGLTMTISDAPLFGKGLDERNQKMAEAIMDALAGIRYTPATVTMAGDPALEPGDRITLLEPGGEVGGRVDCLVTHVVWKYHGQQTLKSVGKNPYLMNAKSAAGKALDKVLAAAKSDSSTFYVYATKNEEALRVGDDEVTVATLDFATVDSARVAFVMTSSHTMTRDGCAVVRLYLDDTLYRSYTDYEARGAHTLTLEYSLEVRGGARYRLRVTMQYLFFLSDRRLDEAARLTLQKENAAALAGRTWGELRDGVALPGGEPVAPDEQHGVIELAAEAVGGVLFGRGLAATDAWDGTLHLQDFVQALKIEGGFVLAGLQDAADCGTGTLMGCTLTEALAPLRMAARFELATLPVDGMALAPAPDNDHLWLTGAGENMADVMLDRELAAVRIYGDAATTYAVSNDSGVTWFNWAGEKWHKVDGLDGQSAEAMTAAPIDSWNALCVDRLRFRWRGGACRYIEIEWEGKA